MRDKDMAKTWCANRAMSADSIKQGRHRANDGVRWGAARLVKNFAEEVEVGSVNP